VPEPGVYELVGRTRDDAAGEAYDKVAKLLGLGYPGGPVVDKQARQGNDQAVALPRPRFTHADRNAVAADLAAARGTNTPLLAEFSFSGLKTAVVRELQRRGVNPALDQAAPAGSGPLSATEVADFCASFQRIVVETLVERTFEAARAMGARSVGISGGVSANSRLRADAIARGEREGLPVFIPALSLSTDNAAMIAAAGLRKMAARGPSPLDFNAEASLPITA